MRITSPVRTLLTVLLLALPMFAPAQETYPARPVRLVVPFPPGGPVDTMARMVSAQLQDALGQRIVVDNRPGAVGTLGTAIVAKAPADGYTLLLTIGAHTIVPALMDVMQYDTRRDFAPIVLLASAPNMLVVKPEFPAGSLHDFIDMARRNPGRYTYSSAGAGSTSHVMATMLGQAAGISLTHVPYQGAAPALQAVLGAQTDLNAAVSTTAAPQIQAGRLRALAIVLPRRSALFPDVPTYAELGFPGVRGDTWIGMLAPADTPRPIIVRWHEELVRFMGMAQTRDKLSALALEPVMAGPAEFDRRIQAELREFAELARSVDLKGR